MATALKVGATFEGAAELEKTIAGMQARYLNPEGAFPFVINLLEENEAAIFRRLHGRFDRTGATRKSLTETAGDKAIRRNLGGLVDFGTGVWYAHFLTRRIGPNIGQKGGGKRTGGSAVLRLTSYRRKQIAQKLLDYCVEGQRALESSTAIAGGDE